MAGPAFRTAGAAAQSASAASLTPGLPTVDTNGNGVLICVVCSKNNAAHSTATAGWTQLAQQNSGAGFTSSVYYAAQSAGVPTITWVGAAACAAQIYYYSDPGAVTQYVVGANSVANGLLAAHTSSSVTTTYNNSRVLLLDVAAANASLATPVGWGLDNGTGLSTAVMYFTADSKLVAVAGASGATASTGANAAWVAWQLEIEEVQDTAGLQSSKLEVAPWTAPPDGLDTAKLEVAPWTAPPAGLDAAKFEVGVWISPSVPPPIIKSRRRAWTYTQDGHTFYIIDLDTEGTFAYDQDTGQWSQFETDSTLPNWNMCNGVMWGDRVVAGDLVSGKIYELDPAITQDDGADISHSATGALTTRSRTYLSNPYVRVEASRGYIGDPASSVLTLSYSDDLGATFTTPTTITLAAGDFTSEIAWRALGSFAAPGRIYQLTDTGGLTRIDGMDASIDTFDDEPEKQAPAS